MKKIIILTVLAVLTSSCGKHIDTKTALETSTGTSGLESKEMTPSEFSHYINETNLTDISSTSGIELYLSDNSKYDYGTITLKVYEDSTPILNKVQMYTKIIVKFKKVTFLNEKEVSLSDLEFRIEGVYGFDWLSDAVARKVEEYLKSTFADKNEIRLRLIDLNIGLFKILSFGNLDRLAFKKE